MNGRPVDLPVVAKAVNEVYKSFNTNQLPLVVLDFTVPRGEVQLRDEELMTRKRRHQCQS
jgi:DNA mismatch repair protein PMS2